MKRLFYKLWNLLHINHAIILKIDGITLVVIALFSKLTTLHILFSTLGILSILLSMEYKQTLSKDMVYMSSLFRKPTLHVNVSALHKADRDKRKAGIRKYFAELPAGTYYFTTHEKMLYTIMGSALKDNLEDIIKTKSIIEVEGEDFTATIRYKRKMTDPSFVVEGYELSLEKIPFFKVVYKKEDKTSNEPI